jgi:hypothetical protein
MTSNLRPPGRSHEFNRKEITMGRSVSIPSGATVVAFDSVDTSDWDEFDAEHEWEWIAEDAAGRMNEIAPSMSPDKGWAGREGMILASNAFAKFGMSSYCGLISYWLIPEEGNGLAEAWCNKIAPKFEETFGSLNYIGSASNGEAFFNRKEA